MFFRQETVDVNITCKSVNNDRIFKEVDQQFMDIIRMDLDALKDPDVRIMTLQLLEEIMEDIAAVETTLDTIEVVCDRTNNTDDDLDNDRLTITIKYQQNTCVNTTEIAYTFSF